MKSKHAIRNKHRKTAEDTLSFEKFVIGATRAISRSCMIEKSSILFCRSRMLRKKSLLISGAGLMLGAGADAGPCIVALSAGWLFGGGGCRERKAGTITKKRQAASGITARRLGLRQHKVYTERKESVCVTTLQVNSLISLF